MTAARTAGPAVVYKDFISKCKEMLTKKIISFTFICIPEDMKTGSANLNFLCNFSQLACLILACLLCCSRLMSVFLGFFLACFLVRDMFSSGCRNNSPPPAPYPPRPAPMLFVPTHNSFFNTSVTKLFKISARLKLVSVPLSSLLLHIVQ